MERKELKMPFFIPLEPKIKIKHGKYAKRKPFSTNICKFLQIFSAKLNFCHF
jgi:hypothetical protein